MGSEELLLEAGKSGELTAVLHTLAETEYNGEPKFSPMICREIGKFIVCRTYATPILELCHLIVAAAALSSEKGRFEYFFWDSGVAKTSVFHTYCQLAQQENNTSSLCTVNSSGVMLGYSDGDFSVQYSRMPVLSALLEFILTALGYVDIDTSLQTILTTNPTKKDVSACANALSRRMYDYLRDHLPTAQSQRKFRKVLAFCDDDIDNVDDAMLLSFWQDASLEQDKGADFKTFESVTQTFIRTIQAVESARDLSAMRHAGKIGMDRDAGEIDPDILSERLEIIEETVTPLLKLTSEPINQIKFLNKQECNHLEKLLSAGDLALRLPLSILRADSFGKTQSRVTQALRLHSSTQDLEEIISEGPEDTYQDRQVIYEKLHDHALRSVYASLHALAQARLKDVITILLKLEPNLDYSLLAQHLIDDTMAANVVVLHQEKIATHFIETLSTPETVGQDIADLLARAQDAHKSLSRKGFKEDPSKNPDIAFAFANGAELLLDISRDIEAFLERLDSLHLNGGGWSSQFSYDRAVFSEQFNKIYIGATQ
jgi:hypothetical protein